MLISKLCVSFITFETRFIKIFFYMRISVRFVYCIYLGYTDSQLGMLSICFLRRFLSACVI